jgi:hypothetical protein
MASSKHFIAPVDWIKAGLEIESKHHDDGMKAVEFTHSL